MTGDPGLPTEVASITQRRVWPLVVIAVMLVHVGILSPHQTCIGNYDALAYEIPAAGALRDAILQHRGPFWFSSVYAGVPLLANALFLALSPWQWLAACLPLQQGVEWMFVAHLLFATLCIYALARSLSLSPMAAATAALVYGLNGSTSRFFEYQYFLGLAWLPFCIWMWEESRRRPGLWWGFVAGYAQILHTSSVHAMLGAVLVPVLLEVLTRQSGAQRLRRLGMGVGACLTASAITLVAWGTFAGLALGSDRVRVTIPHFLDGNALDTSEILSLFLPFAQFSPLAFGASVTLLALVGVTWRGGPDRLRVRYGWLVPVGVLMALGSAGLIYPALAFLLPPLRFVRGCVLWLNLAVCGLAMLAALGVTRVQQTPGRLARLAWVVPLLVMLDLFNAYPIRLQPRTVLDVPAGWTQVAGHDSWRVYWQFPIDRLYTGELVGRDNVLGRDPCCPESFLEYLWYIDHAEPPPPSWWAHEAVADNLIGPTEVWTSPLLRLLDVRLRWHRVLGWQEVPSPLPRYYLVSATRTLADRHALFSDLRDHPFDVVHTVWLQHGGTPGTGTGPSGGDVQVLLRQSGVIALEVQTAQPSWLVVSEASARGWHATLDDQSVPVVQADGALQAVQVPAGSHRVTLFFRPVHLRRACVGTVVACLGVLAWLAWRRPAPRVLLIAAGAETAWMLAISIRLLANAAMPPVPLPRPPPVRTLTAPAGSTVVADVRLVEPQPAGWAEHEVIEFKSNRSLQDAAGELSVRYGLHPLPQDADGIVRMGNAPEGRYRPSGVTWLELEPSASGCRGILTRLTTPDQSSGPAGLGRATMKTTPIKTSPAASMVRRFRTSPPTHQPRKSAMTGLT